jgi:transcriptional regulator with XRE-family HTH domain
MKSWYNFFMETTIQIMGQKIRQLRIDSRLTLEGAAERAGCTAGFLSNVERNQAVPSITMLYAIAQALGVNVTHFFPRTTSAAQVVRAGERETFRFEGSPIAYTILSNSFPDRNLEFLLVQVDPLDGTLPSDEFRSHPGEELAYVLEGALRIWIGDAIYDLNPGDSIHFESTIKHRIENLGNEPMVYLSVLTPPVF